jgi:hypothetical protein
MKTLICEREAAQLLGVSVALLRKQRYLGTGCPYVKLNRIVRYRLEDIEAYVSDHVTGLTTKGHGEYSEVAQ